MKPTRLSAELQMLPEPSGSVVLMRTVCSVTKATVPGRDPQYPYDVTEPVRVSETAFRLSAFELKALIAATTQPK